MSRNPLRKGGGGEAMRRGGCPSVLVTDRRTEPRDEPRDAVCERGHPLAVHQGPRESCAQCYGCEEFRQGRAPSIRTSSLAWCWDSLIRGFSCGGTASAGLCRLGGRIGRALGGGGDHQPRPPEAEGRGRRHTVKSVDFESLTREEVDARADEIEKRLQEEARRVGPAPDVGIHGTSMLASPPTCGIVISPLLASA
jgi:hypothetical protein